MEVVRFGATGLDVPPIIFGTSCLGNLYEAVPEATKHEIVTEYFRQVPPPVVLDSAGKYGAGLALEVIGNSLRELRIPPAQVLLSNKLAWLRRPLHGPEPTFEPGVWAGLKHDAEQCIGGAGIRACWEQGCELLGAPYRPQLASVHDPDEYLAEAVDETDAERRWDDVLDAYRTLFELKAHGQVAAVGVGAKDWTVIRRLAAEVDLDWVMFACSLTIRQHPPDLVAFIDALTGAGVGIVNSAVFHAGFLVGGRYFDYRVPDVRRAADRELFAWRDRFHELCAVHGVSPAAACVQFALSPPGVASIALNTGKPHRVAENVALVQTQVPDAFWRAMKAAGLIAGDYPYVG
jgi:D-threo-aldose 1-dehydrogenase